MSIKSSSCSSKVVVKTDSKKVETVISTKTVISLDNVSSDASLATTIKASSSNKNDSLNKDKTEISKLLGGRNTTLDLPLSSIKVMSQRYLKTDGDGKVMEIPEEMFYRVADSLAAIDLKFYGSSRNDYHKLRGQFYDMMMEMKFTPAGRTLANSGCDTKVVANCIVLHIEDSLDKIFETLHEASLLQQLGSGIGFPFHLLRPADETTKRTLGRSSGPISFLRVYNMSFGVIKQKNRHGANMGVMSVDHPDILEFIHCKDKEGDLKNFNISVGLTDKFMKAVKEDDPNPWVTNFNNKEFGVRKITRDENFSVISITDTKMRARELFMEIVSSAWKTGEPGCVFLDTVNVVNPLPGLGKIEACNPCGLW